jgi:hypothetical protein
MMRVMAAGFSARRCGRKQRGALLVVVLLLAMVRYDDEGQLMMALPSFLPSFLPSVCLCVPSFRLSISASAMMRYDESQSLTR